MGDPWSLKDWEVFQKNAADLVPKVLAARPAMPGFPDFWRVDLIAIHGDSIKQGI